MIVVPRIHSDLHFISNVLDWIGFAVASHGSVISAQKPIVYRDVSLETVHVAITIIENYSYSCYYVSLVPRPIPVFQCYTQKHVEKIGEPGDEPHYKVRPSSL